MFKLWKKKTKTVKKEIEYYSQPPILNNIPTGYTLLKEIFKDYKKSNEGSFSFETKVVDVKILQKDVNLYLYVLEAICSSENNGRPSTSIKEYCIEINSIDDVNQDNWEHLFFKAQLHKIENITVLQDSHTNNWLPEEYFGTKI